MSSWFYVRSESQLWTVGYEDSHGTWHSDSDWGNRDDARARVHFLNGGDAKDAGATDDD